MHETLETLMCTEICNFMKMETNSSRHKLGLCARLDVLHEKKNTVSKSLNQHAVLSLCHMDYT